MAAPNWLKLLVRMLSLGLIKAGKDAGWIDPAAKQKPEIKTKQRRAFMRHWTREHLLLVIAALGFISVQLTGVTHWHEVLTPAFLAGLVGQLAVVLRAIYVAKPTPPWDGAERRGPQP